MLSEHISNATPSQLEALRRRQKFYQSVNKQENSHKSPPVVTTQLHHAYVEEAAPVIVASPPSQPLKADYFPGNAKSVVKLICKGVSHYFTVDHDEIMLPIRTSRIATARQIAFVMTKEITGWSLPDIGRRFGGKDHTTVLHGLRKIARMRAKDNEFDDKLNRLKTDIVAAIKAINPDFTLPGERQRHVPEQQGQGAGTDTVA